MTATLRKQAGFTVIEIVVALTVLSIGSAVLWYTVRSSARIERLNRLHHEANSLARSELESLRSVPRAEIRDTSYRAAAGGEEVLVVREVFDSAKVVSTLDEVALDDRMRPQELRKPLEVRVRVLRTVDAEGAALPDPLDAAMAAGTEEEGGRRPALATLVLKIPEYKWR